MVNSFAEVLAAKRDKVWGVIEGYLGNPKYPQAFSIPSHYDGLCRAHWEIVREYPERKGKYIRPTLVMLTAAAMGVRESLALQTAAAMQVSEDWLLIHDDLEDDSEFRRGKPTLHKMFGDKLAINAGDALHVIMWKILLDNQKILKKDVFLRVLEEFYVMVTRTVLGQGGEIKWAIDGRIGLDDSDWFFIADGKTSYYTVAGPMRLGGIIAGGTPQQLSLLTDFGKRLGRCYQLVDDILDLTSDFRGLKGKLRFNDLYEGKTTMILAHLLRSARKSEREEIINFLAKPRGDKKESEVLKIVGLMHKRGSIMYAREKAKKIGEEARDIFEGRLRFLSKNPARSYLKMGISFILDRDY